MTKYISQLVKNFFTFKNYNRVYLNKRILFIVILLFVTLPTLFFFIYTYNTHKQTLQQDIEFNQETIKNIYDKKLEEWEKEYILRLKFIINTTHIKNLILNNDIENLKKELNIRYNSIKGGNGFINTFHYIDQDNVSVYRAHKPDEYGDDLTSIRPIIVRSNLTKKVQTGIEAGKHAFSYRITYPIVYNNIHYGVLELGFDMRFLKEIVQGIIDDVSSTILIKDSKANKKYLKGLKEYSNAFIYHDDFDITAKRLIFVDKNRLKIGDKRYICIEYDLEDFTDENVVGHVVYFKEYTESHSRFVKQIIFVSLVSIIFLILLILIIYFGLQFYEKELTKEIKMKEEKEDLLRKQNRLAIMGEMIAMIAHQWRQPLAAIMASSQAIKLKKRLNKLTDEFEDEKLKDIENLTKHLSVTIDDFKNFFKQDKQLVVCNPAELIQKTVEFLDHRIKMNSIVVNIIDKFDSKIETYSSELLQVSMNIITNSIDELSQKEQNIKAIDITIVGDEKYLYIIISDNAGGIPLNIIGKIFEPYFSTKGKNGTGLGLYMSKVIVDKHLKGHLSVSNSIEGANFHIKIPLSC